MLGMVHRLLSTKGRLFALPGFRHPFYTRQHKPGLGWLQAKEDNRETGRGVKPQVYYAPENPMSQAEVVNPAGVGAIPVVLIVDDQPEVTRALGHLFTKSGFTPATFQSAAEAMEFVEQHTPAAAVIDIHLPDLSGLVLSQRLRDKLGDKVPIIVLSGDASLANLNSLEHVGATHFFSKPVKWSMLLERVRELMA